MPKGRKELHALKPSGSISTIQTTGSLCFYLCSPLLLFLTLRYTQSTVCGSEALPHPSPSNLLDSNTHSPQSFISSSSAVYGVMLKTQNSGTFQLEKKKKSVVFFVFVFFSPEDTFCCFYSGVVQTAVSLKGQQAAAQCKDREPVLSASFLWMGSM